MKKKKKIILIVLACLVFAAIVAGIITRTKKIYLEDWKDESIVVELYEDVALSTEPVYDKEGNVYSVRAQVRQADGTFVNAVNNMFRAEYAGGYTIEYTAGDENVKAASRTVTVKIKDSDTPAPYFTKSRLVVYEDTEFAVPEYGCALDPEIGIASQTLTLDKVEGESRTKAEADLSKDKISLSAGTYVFKAEVKAENGKTGEAELFFRVRSDNERGALAALNDEYSNVLGSSFWDTSINGWNMASTYFTDEVHRNEYVSLGSVYAEMPGSAAVAGFYVLPELSKEEFVSTMSKEGAIISIWLCIQSEDGLPRMVTYGKESVEARDGVWTNVRIRPEEVGYEGELEKFYSDMAVGKSKLIEIRNPSGEPYTVYFDSIYASEPITAEFPAVSCTYQEEVTVKAESALTDRFYYELFDITEADRTTQLSGDGRFVPRIAGTLHAMAYPAANRYYADQLVATVTVNGGISFGFDKDRMFMDSGWNDRPNVVSGSGKENIKYWITTLDDTECYSYLDGSKLRIFEGEYILYGEARIGGTVYSAYSWITGNKAPVNKGDLENFDSPSSLKNVTSPESFTYVGDYEGASGVIRYNAGKAGIWPGFMVVKPQQTLEELARDFNRDDLLAIRFRVENLPNNYFMYYTLAYGGGEDQYVGHISPGWQTLYIPASVFFDNSDIWFDKARFCFTNNVENDAEIYIDWIRLVKGNRTGAAQDAQSAEYQNFSDPYCAMEMARKCEGLPLNWVQSGLGTQGLLKLQTVQEETWPTIRCFQPKMSRQQYLDLGYGQGDFFVVRIYNANAYENYIVDYNLGNSGENKSLGILKQGWNELRLDATEVLDNWDAFADGTAFIVFTKNNEPALHELYVDSMYFEKRSRGVQTDRKADFIDFTDGAHWEWYFATRQGREYCSYDETKSAIHFQGYGPWPFPGGLSPVAPKVHYERFEKEIFVLEMEVNSYSSVYEAVGSFPKLRFRDKEGNETPYAVIDHTGTYRIEIPASVIFDNWEGILDGSCRFLFYDGGGEITVDCYFKGMYFEKSVRTDVSRDGILTITSGADVYTVTCQGQELAARADGTYDLSRFAEAGRESYDIPVKVTRRDENGNVISEKEILWSTPGAGYEINCFGSQSGFERVQAASGIPMEYLAEKADDNGITKQGVAKINFSLLNSPWPTVRFGDPLCEKPEGGKYNYVIFTMYAEGDLGNLVLEYKDQTTNGVIKEFKVKEGWAEYRLPIELFDYDEFAKGNQILVASAYGWPVTNTLYIDSIRYENIEVPEAEITGTTAEFMNFTSVVSLDNFGIVQGQRWCEWVEAYEGAQGLIHMKASGIWPTVNGFDPVLDKQAYLDLGYQAGDDFVIRLYKANEDGGVQFYYNVGAGDTSMGYLETGWNTFRIDAGVVLDNWDKFVDGTAFFMPTNNAEITHDLYFDSMYFEKNVNAAVSSDGILTISGGGDTYTVIYDGQELAARADGTYDLSSFAEAGRESYDILVEVTRRDGAGNVIAEKEIRWSTPGAEYEINCFGSQSGFERVQAASGIPMEYLTEKADDNGITKQGVAKIDFSLLNSPWPSVRFGAPLCEKPEDGKYNYVVFTMYAEGDLGNLVLEYKDQATNEVIKDFKVKEGWTEYWLPIELFDYDEFAGGNQILVASAYGWPVTNTLYIDSIRYEELVAGAEITETTAEFMNFTSSRSLEDFGTVQGKKWSNYVEEFEGAKGLIHLKRFETWPNIKGFKPVLDKQAYLDLGYQAGDDFVIRLYKANGDGGVQFYYNVGAGNTSMGYLETGWNTLRIDAGIVLDNWDKFVDGTAFFMPTNNAEITHDLYFDSMYFEKREQSAEINGFGSEADITGIKAANDGLSVNYIERKEDSNGVVKQGVVAIDLANAGTLWPGVKFGTPLCKKPEAGKFGYVVFTMYMENAPANLGADYYSFNGANNEAVAIFKMQQGWAEYWVPVDKFDYDKLANGQQWFTFYNNVDVITQTVYIDSIRYANRTEALVTDTTAEFLNFSDNAFLERFGTVEGKDWSSYVEEFDGAQGLIHLNVLGAWPTIRGFKPMLDKQAYVDLGYGAGDYFVIRLYKENWDGGVMWVYNTGAEGAANVELSMEQHGWQTIKIDAGVVLDHWDNFVNGTAFFMPTNNAGITHDLYFDAMYFEKSQQTASIGRAMNVAVKAVVKAVEDKIWVGRKRMKRQSWSWFLRERLM